VTPDGRLFACASSIPTRSSSDARRMRVTGATAMPARRTSETDQRDGHLNIAI
jgi:hypothetical protein